MKLLGDNTKYALSNLDIASGKKRDTIVGIGAFIVIYAAVKVSDLVDASNGMSWLILASFLVIYYILAYKLVRINSWTKDHYVTVGDFEKLETEISKGKCFQISNYLVTPNYALFKVVGGDVLVPFRDVIYIYLVHTATYRKKKYKYSRYDLIIFMRDKKSYSIPISVNNSNHININTDGTVQLPYGNAEGVIKIIKQQTSNTYPGIIYGYSKEKRKRILKNYSEMVKMVDSINANYSSVM